MSGDSREFEWRKQLSDFEALKEETTECINRLSDGKVSFSSLKPFTTRVDYLLERFQSFESLKGGYFSD